MPEPRGWQGFGDVTKPSANPSVPNTPGSATSQKLPWEGLCDADMTKPHATPSVPGQK